MATYKYRAKKGPGKVTEAIIVANSKEEAVEKIAQLGYIAVKVEEINAQAASPSAAGVGFLWQGVKSKHITIFSRQLSILLKSGVPILNALGVLAEQTDQAYFRTVMDEIRKDVKDGKALSLALARYPHIFSPLYLALVRAGEDSGTLEEALLRIAEYRYKQEKMLTTIRTALTYPILMALVGLGTIIFMLTFVMPRLLKIFFRLGQELPLPTKILIYLSDFLRHYWFWIVLALAGLGLLARFASRSKRERLLVSNIKLHLPVFGGIFLKAELACFSRTLGLLLKSGVQLLRAIKVSIPTLDNEIIREDLKQSYQDIEQGESLGSSLKRKHIFPRFLVNLISVGEESGRVEETLEELAQIYEAETDEAVKIMTNLLEPILILIMGVVVGFIIISMLLPVFQINMMIG